VRSDRRHRPLTATIVAVVLVAGCASAPTDEPAATPVRTATAPATAPPEPIAHRIGVRVVDGAGELYDVASQQPFVPRGMNLIRLADGRHSTLDVGRFDAAAVTRALDAMAAAGYNTVRVFLDTFPGGLPGPGVTPLSDAYLDNVVALLELAADRDIQVLLTTDWLPESPAYAFESDPGIENVNAMYLSRGGVAANERFFADFARGLVDRRARLDALLAYELRNELYFTNLFPPFSLSSGLVATANGRTYDVASVDDQIAMLEENLISWVDSMRAAILAVDPTALVTVGFFQPKGPNTSRVGDDRVIETRRVILESTADFIDLHGYPGGELNLRQIVENFKVPGTTLKPILLGEFGAERNANATVEDAVRSLVEWQVESCEYGFDGWATWTWDSVEQPSFWNALDGNGAIAEALSPAARPDPCSIGDLDIAQELTRGATATASSALPDRPAALAIDGLFDTLWNAVTGPPQWIEIDLGRPRTVAQIRLTVAQDPAGQSRHVVSVRGDGGAWRQVAVIERSTADGESLLVDLPASLVDVRFVRVETTGLAGGLWPAWREISVLGR